MKNLTAYNDQFILHLIKQVNGNPYKCIANVQYAVKGNNLIPVLEIYQDCSIDWDNECSNIFCERVDAVDFCDNNHISLDELHAIQEYYSSIALQKDIDNAEYELECEEMRKKALDKIWDSYEQQEKRIREECVQATERDWQIERIANEACMKNVSIQLIYKFFSEYGFNQMDITKFWQSYYF